MDNAIIRAEIKETEYIHRDNRVTICIAITCSGYYIVGTSFCLDTKEFSEGLGEQYAYEDVIRQLEPMMGYYEKLKE